MKDYLNRAEKENFVVLWVTALRLQDTAAQASFIPEDKRSTLKRAATMARNILEDVFRDVKPADARAIYNQAALHEIALIPAKSFATHEAQIRLGTEHRIKEEYEKAGMEPKDAQFDFVELLLKNVCSGCDGSPRKTCDIFSKFQTIGVEEWDRTRKCQYSGAGVV